MSKLLLEDAADFVIVGTGAGGATAARVLAAAGLDVVMLEEGPWLKTKERPTELVDGMTATFRDFGTQTTSGATPIPLLQGRLVGGSTAINSGIIWRLPDDVRAVFTTIGAGAAGLGAEAGALSGGATGSGAAAIGAASTDVARGLER